MIRLSFVGDTNLGKSDQLLHRDSEKIFKNFKSYSIKLIRNKIFKVQK